MLDTVLDEMMSMYTKAALKGLLERRKSAINRYLATSDWECPISIPTVTRKALIDEVFIPLSESMGNDIGSACDENVIWIGYDECSVMTWLIDFSLLSVVYDYDSQTLLKNMMKWMFNSRLKVHNHETANIKVVAAKDGKHLEIKKNEDIDEFYKVFILPIIQNLVGVINKAVDIMPKSEQNNIKFEAKNPSSKDIDGFNNAMGRYLQFKYKISDHIAKYVIESFDLDDEDDIAVVDVLLSNDFPENAEAIGRYVMAHRNSDQACCICDLYDPSKGLKYYWPAEKVDKQDQPKETSKLDLQLSAGFETMYNCIHELDLSNLVILDESHIEDADFKFNHKLAHLNIYIDDAIHAAQNSLTDPAINRDKIIYDFLTTIGRACVIFAEGDDRRYKEVFPCNNSTEPLINMWADDNFHPTRVDWSRKIELDASSALGKLQVILTNCSVYLVQAINQ